MIADLIQSTKLSEVMEVITGLSSLGAVIVAFLALRNWKRQDKAKLEAEFLDEVLKAAQDYVTIMPRALALLASARIGIISHAHDYRADARPTRDGAIAYISKHGVNIGERIRASLSEIQPSVVKLRTLGDKGQIFRFSQYTTCFNGIIQITWHYGRIDAFLSVVEYPAWNWENPQVISSLDKILEIDPVEIQKELDDQYKEILKFIRSTYESIYNH